MESFTAKIFKIGINPCVDVPEKVLNDLFRQAGRTKGPIPVRGRLNGKGFKQRIVKFRGAWRLYLNTQMRRDAVVDSGDQAKVDVEFDPQPRVVPMHRMLARALGNERGAKKAFENLPPSRQREILRYLHSLKTEESVLRTVRKVVRQLTGKKSQGLTHLARR